MYKSTLHSEQTEVKVYCQSELYSRVTRKKACFNFNIYAINKEMPSAALSVYGHTIYRDGNTTNAL